MKKSLIFLLSVFLVCALAWGCAAVPAASSAPASPTPAASVSAAPAQTSAPANPPLPTPAPSESAAAVPSSEPVALPLKLEGIRFETDSIGTPEVLVRVRNTGSVPVDAFDFAVKCLNNYGEVVKGYNTQPYAGCTFQADDGPIEPGGVWSANDNDEYWPLYGFDSATHFEVAITRVHTTDGKTVSLFEDEYQWVAQNE